MLRRLTLAAAAITLCAGPALAQTITGSVTFPERVALPATAVLEVTLHDVSRADAPAAALVVARLVNPGPPPYAYELDYDATVMHPGRRYAVRARVIDRDRLLFATTQTAPVVTQGHGVVADLVMRQVAVPAPPADAGLVSAEAVDLPMTPIDAARARLSVPGRRPSAAPILTSLPATFTGTLPCDGCPGIRVQLNLMPGDAFFLRMTDQRRGATPREDLGSWAVSSDGLVLVLGGRDGEVTQFLFRDAVSLRPLDATGEPVGTSARNDLRRTSSFQPLEFRMELQGAYSRAGDVGLFTECSSGRTWTLAEGSAARTLESQAAGSTGDPIVVTIEGRVGEGVGGGADEAALTVDRLVDAPGRTSCGPRFTSAPLDRTRWELARLGRDDRPLAAGSGAVPHLTFDAQARAFAGAAGCSHLVGRYDTDGDSIAMELGGTMRACAATATDAALDAAIRAARSFRAVGRQLYLFDESGEVVALFRAAD